MRPNPQNNFRWVFDNGASFNPIGIGDCIRDVDKNGSPLDDWGFDGGFRLAGQHVSRQTDIDTYLKAYSEAGLNLFRWSVDNCAFNLHQKIVSGGNVYPLDEGRWGDQLVQKLRQYGLRTYTAIFGFNRPGGAPPPQHLDPHQTPQSTPFRALPSAPPFDAIKRYVKHVVDRYGNDGFRPDWNDGPLWGDGLWVKSFRCDHATSLLGLYDRRRGAPHSVARPERGTQPVRGARGESPLDILKLRFAKGEITKEQFNEIKVHLGS